MSAEKNIAPQGEILTSAAIHEILEFQLWNFGVLKEH